MDTLPVDYEIPSSFCNNVVQLSRSFRCVAQLDKTSDDITVYRNLVMKSLQQCEKEITQIRSFQMKFPNENISEILSQSNNGRCSSTEFFPNFIKVPNGKRSELGSRIFDLFVTGNETNEEDLVLPPQHTRKVCKFGKSYRRAFVLKYVPLSRGSTISLPQRMSCLLRNEAFVLALTFSNKTDFL